MGILTMGVYLLWQPHLNGKHVVFGRVVGGLPTLDAVEAVGSTSGSTSLPVDITACSVTLDRSTL